MNILTLVDGFPTEKNPYRWVHVIEQMKEIGKTCNVYVISPTKTYLPFEKDEVRANPFQEAKKEGSVLFFQPRYFDLSRFVRTVFRYLHLETEPRWVYFLKDFSIWASVVWCVVRYRLSVDLIHAHFVYWPGYVGSLVSRSLHKKLVITAHGSDLHPAGREDIDEERRWRRIGKALSTASLITVVSEDLADKIGSMGVPLRRKVEVIPIGVNRTLFVRMDRTACRERIGLKSGKKYLLYIGNLVPVKGPDLLLEAYRIVRRIRDDIELILVGDGCLYDEMVAKIDEYGCKDSVHLPGGIPHPDVAVYLNASDVLVVPSRQEGRSVVIMEALSCGMPVVAFNVGGISETLHNANLGILVPPGNIGALAESIVNAIEQKWDTETIRQSIEGYFQDKVAQEFIHRYVQIGATV